MAVLAGWKNSSWKRFMRKILGIVASRRVLTHKMQQRNLRATNQFSETGQAALLGKYGQLLVGRAGGRPFSLGTQGLFAANFHRANCTQPGRRTATEIGIFPGAVES